MASLVLVVLLAAVAPSWWHSGGWHPNPSGTGLWVSPTADTPHSTAPRFPAGGAEHLPAAGELRSLPATHAVAARAVPSSAVWLSTGPTAVPRRDIQRIVTSRGPPPA